MIADRFKKDFPNKRLFFLARSGYAGTQRYGIVPWSGDISRSWGGLKAQLPAMLNMSLSGIPYMHSDAGGFATGVKDDELYTRWLQFAVFTPILRPHGSGIPSEPIFFNDTTQRIVRHFMKLRYELLPYIYTTAWQTAQTGIPIVRPMLWQNTNDRRFSELFSQYYFGNDLLVCPVTEAGQLRLDVELPAGLWYHF
ncbi:MAG: xylosidase, partial [Bacteroidales bacterium]|nr:xylosidase [Bacteroidales bacterium]